MSSEAFATRPEEEKVLLIGDQSRCSNCDRFYLDRRATTVAALVQILLLVTYIATVVFLVLRNDPKVPTSVNGMSDLQIKYEEKVFTAFQDSSFTGTPSPKSDHAWRSILSKMTIRVSESELQQGNQSSVALPNGGYMAWLGVYHELHCVKFLRQWKYRDHYFPYLSKEEERHKDVHADHCIEMLRSAALCRADTSLTTFHWESQTRPMLDLKRPRHVCVNWEVLKASIEHRVVPEEEGSRLFNPNLRGSGL